MKTKKEKKYLENILRKLESIKQKSIVRKWSSYLICFLSGMLISLGKGLFETGKIDIWLFMIITSITGALLVGLFLKGYYEKYWSILKPHIDRESIKRHIESL